MGNGEENSMAFRDRLGCTTASRCHFLIPQFAILSILRLVHRSRPGLLHAGKCSEHTLVPSSRCTDRKPYHWQRELAEEVRAGGITHRTPKRTLLFPPYHASPSLKARVKTVKMVDINILSSPHNPKDMLRTPARAKIRGMRAAGKSYSEIKKLTSLERLTMRRSRGR